jgi:hypothetical protein
MVLAVMVVLLEYMVKVQMELVGHKQQLQKVVQVELVQAVDTVPALEPEATVELAGQ